MAPSFVPHRDVRLDPTLDQPAQQLAGVVGLDLPTVGLNLIPGVDLPKPSEEISKLLPRAMTEAPDVDTTGTRIMGRIGGAVFPLSIRHTVTIVAGMARRMRQTLSWTYS